MAQQDSKIQFHKQRGGGVAVADNVPRKTPISDVKKGINVLVAGIQNMISRSFGI